MIVAQARTYLRGNPQERSLCAALQAMIAYAQGLEECRITVGADAGRIILSGEVSSTDALDTAVVIAEVFTGRPVVSELSVKPTVRPAVPRPLRPVLVAGLACSQG